MVKILSVCSKSVTFRASDPALDRQRPKLTTQRSWQGSILHKTGFCSLQNLPLFSTKLASIHHKTGLCSPQNWPLFTTKLASVLNKTGLCSPQNWHLFTTPVWFYRSIGYIGSLVTIIIKLRLLDIILFYIITRRKDIKNWIYWSWKTNFPSIIA